MFIDGASHGVILFTLGSAVKTSSLSSKKREEFVKAFATIPQRVIWNFEGRIENLPNNIMLSSWTPQRDILGKKVPSNMENLLIGLQYSDILLKSESTIPL